jgi:acetolactate synthase-1/2/3 large subunit
VLGSRLNIRQTSYNWQSFAQNAWIAQVDVDPAELAKPTIKPDQAIVADINQFFDALDALLELERLPNYSAWASWCRNTNLEYSAIREHSQKENAPLNPYLLVDRVFKLLRDDDVVVCGNASACILPFQVGSLRPHQRLFSNSGSASMGYDLPAAIGAATACAAKSNGRVICFAGDGSLQMNIQELQTLKTVNSNVIVIVLNNGGYLSIWQTHENFFGRVIGATPASGVEFPDFSAVAKAYGIRAAKIQGEEDIETLERLLGEDGPLLLDVVVDPRQEFAPRIKSRVDEEGRFVTPELDDMYPFLDQERIRKIRASAMSVKAVARPGEETL